MILSFLPFAPNGLRCLEMYKPDLNLVLMKITMVTVQEYINHWRSFNNPSHPLKLDDLGLESLPELPTTVQRLSLRNNRLESLDGLPDSLLWLDATNNRLCALPSRMPPHLEALYVSYNAIRIIPSMPASLKVLSAAYNPITSFGDLPGIAILKIPAECDRLLPVLPRSALYVNDRLVWSSNN